MNYVYVAINNNQLIKIGTTTDPEHRQQRFNNVPKHHLNSNMRIKKVISLTYDSRAYALAVESLLRYDLNTYSVINTTMDTFKYSGALFRPSVYIAKFADKVAHAEQILSHIKTTGHLL
jgi:predicted GIY-YIG superfamily endonuclease